MFDTKKKQKKGKKEEDNNELTKVKLK